MTLDEVLAYVSKRGGEVWVDGQHVRMRGPKGLLTPELRDSLLEHKEELVSSWSKINVTETTFPPALTSVPRDKPLPLEGWQRCRAPKAQPVERDAQHVILHQPVLGQLGESEQIPDCLDHVPLTAALAFEPAIA